MVMRTSLVGELITLLLLFLVTPLVSAQGSAANIRISADSPSIYLGDTVVLDVEATGLLEPLDVARLFDQAEFLRETTGTRIAVSGGRVVEIALRRMEFKPLAAGTIIFGPLAGDTQNGTLTSNSVAITVLPPPDTDWQPAADDLSINMTLSSNQAYVGEQIMLEISLEHRYPIASEEIVLPSLNAFESIAVFEERRTLDTSGMRQTRWRYLLHPREAHTVSLDAVTWRGTMTRSRTQRSEFWKTSPSASLLVEVPPTENGNDWWLPATSVRLEDQWSKDVRTLSAGEEVERVITLSATGVLSHQLPTIKPLPSRAISSILIRTEREHRIIENQSQATAKFTFRMTAESPIPVFLDTVRVAWWDLEENNAREAIIPARRINVGLPERADVLAKLAAENSATYRLTTLAAQFSTSARWIWLVPVLSALVALWTVAQAVQPQQRFMSWTGKIRRRQATRRWRQRFVSAVQAEQWCNAHDLLKHQPARSTAVDDAWLAIGNDIGRLAYGNQPPAMIQDSCKLRQNIMEQMNRALSARHVPVGPLAARSLPPL